MNQKPNGTQYVPGVLLAALTAGLSMVLGKAVPILGSSLFAILCGILLNASQLLPQNSRPGLAYSGKTLAIFHYIDGLYHVFSKGDPIGTIFFGH